MDRPLSSVVEISRQFLRSIRIDTDYGREDALQGYICQGSARSVLENMARQVLETRQRAFTWTGPFGGGKSSLALMLCSLVSPDGKVRKKAQEILDLPAECNVNRAFNPSRQGWLVIPISGKRDSLVGELSSELSRILGITLGKKAKPSEIIQELVKAAEARPDSGVLLVVDELGKFLEAAALSGDDIFFYQELAEAASRCNGKLIIVGILHQAFEQYATRLGREARDEWAKVQGRFVDIPLVAGSDEVIELISKAIIVKSKFDNKAIRSIVEPVADTIRRRRPGTPTNLADGLYRCWPLHPVTAALLGPMSKRRFGQNERSTFGFLTSAEPLGFSEFLSGVDAMPHSVYEPFRYWEYLRANLEPAILASPDGHRWALAAEAVERAEARGTKLHVDLTKTIALIDMFRNGSGLIAEDGIINASVPHSSPGDVRNALEDLARWSILIYRKHLEAWGVYAGSDFDIDAAVTEARSEIGEADFRRLTELSDLYPILAKRYYHETGTLRWLSRAIVRGNDAMAYVEDYEPTAGSCGEFVLVLPSSELTKRGAATLSKKLSMSDQSGRVVIGVPSNVARLTELGLELAALERVYSTRPELEGDSVARRELDGRMRSVRSELEEELRDAFNLARWHHMGQPMEVPSGGSLSPIASNIAFQIYSETPHFHSELLNRASPSSNSVKARRDLLYRMLKNAGDENLGYQGYPADAGLYFTLLKITGLHREDDGCWVFSSPSEYGRGATLKPLWEQTIDMVRVPDKITSLAEIYALWSAPPFGVQAGVMPVLALAFFLSFRQNLAMYVDGLFAPDLTEAHLDEWLLDPSLVTFRYVEIEAQRKELLTGLAANLSTRLGRAISTAPLDSARGLVAFALDLPGWTRRTTTISPLAQDVRRVLLKASDPHKVLFNDLPVLMGTDDGRQLVERVGVVISELVDAYPNMLRQVQQKLMGALDHSLDDERIRQRGATVKGITGDFRLDALAARLTTYSGTLEDVEGLISLAVNKPARDWVDRDIDAAVMQLGEWAIEFRRAEALAGMRDRPATRRAFAVVFGTANGHSVSDAFDVLESDTPAVDDLVKSFLSTLQANNHKREVFLAALAETGARILEATRGSSND